MSDSKRIREFADGELYFWIEAEGSIHLKAVSPFGDPVELTSEEAKELGEALLDAARHLDPLTIQKATEQKND